MKKFVLLAIGIMMVSAPVFSYDINDAVGDRIGDWKFEVYGIDVVPVGSTYRFDIFTNYPQAGFTVGSWNTFAGDLALSTTDGYDWSYGVALTSHDGMLAGQMFSNATWNISNDYAPSGYIYNKDQIVTLNSGTYFGDADVTWNALSGGPDYKISIMLPDVPVGYLPDFRHTYWASATCANDFVGAPEPISTILFITGGTVLLARRMRRVKK